ncbi:MAG TPA: fumarylacetoacetate hydrolase family protein [Anaeromyxobacteraceae bacterium]|nr:fumarylacetoacetate hydrolase family protein [Anaeromyxobacteraceae bacterium]
MIACRFRLGFEERYGAIDGSTVRALSAEPWGGGLPQGPARPLSEVSLVAPVAPSKVVCVGKNYAAHAREMGLPVVWKQPLLFLKPSTAVVGPAAAIRIPEASQEVHHEAELAAVIGHPLTAAKTATEARQAIFGWTCLNDVTARDIQRAELHFTRAKSFDTFCPIGPVIETNLDPLDTYVVCRVNGEERQRGSTKDMIVDPYLLIALASQAMTLLPGDVVATGTPAGVGPLKRGDLVEVEIGGIGVLKNPVI